jgi:hypothetical protein
MSSSSTDHFHASVPALNPFDGMEYIFSLTVVDKGRQLYHLYGADGGHETIFSAMTFGSNGITICALDVVVIDDSPPVTIGYFHLKDDQELIAIIHDNDFGNFRLQCSI